MADDKKENWESWTDEERGRLVALLRALDRQLSDARGLAGATLAAVVRQHFIPYYGFRRQVDEAMSVIVIIEDLMAGSHDERSQLLRAELARLSRSLLVLFIETVHGYFAEMARSGAMPLEARHLFRAEKQGLDQARRRLDEETADGEAGGHDPTLHLLAEDAERLIDEVLEMAPALPDFDEEEITAGATTADSSASAESGRAGDVPMGEFGLAGWMP